MVVVPAMLACPDETQLARFLEGALSEPDADRIELHADGCPLCRGLVADVILMRSRSRASRPASIHESAEDPWRAASPSSLDAGRRYRVLELLGQGGMGQVVRAVDRLTGREVALKSVRCGSAPSGSGRRRASKTPLAALAQEFRVLATLRHPNVIAVLDYGFDAERMPYFSMELVAGARPLLPYARGAPREAQVDLLVQLLRALGYLHRRGVLHRDLKPSNILVTAGGALKVVDFGLAALRDDAEKEPAAGTLPYMAPELFQGAAASEASDLYAVGVVAYEMLTGHHPLREGGSAAALIAEVIAREPDLSPLPPSLRTVVGRALEKSPADRPASAAALLAELSAAAGLPLDRDPSPVRDSYLVAARFIGREDELGRLRSALDEAREGRGSVFLVGGESGVGKSRLLDELRSQALVEGVLVARGQALPSGGNAHHLWRGVLEVLALHVELSDLEASVIGAVLPKLAALIERKVAPLPELAAEVTRFRLLHVLSEVVRRSQEPVLVLLEDLQWADEESLALLEQVGQDLGRVPLLVVASYRDDEAAGLPARLPAAAALRLGRLDRFDIALLCASMLGPGRTDERLFDRIVRETEGNTYFIVEVVRALAEESGGLDEIGRIELPERILAGGVEHVFGRKLARVPAEARPLLHLAAVAGRQLDLDVLSKSVPGLEGLVRSCAEVGLLEVHEQRWRFAHDKLRERALGELDEGTRRRLHARVALGIEATYPDSAEHAAAVAYHYREAARPAEAARSYAIAGEAALSRGALRDAEVMLDQALLLRPEGPAPPCWDLRVWRGLAQARFGLGRLADTEAAVQRVCALAGAPLPEGRLGYAWAVGRAALEQAARRAGLPFRPPGEAARALGEELLLGLSVQEIFIWLARPELLVLCTLRGLNLEDALGARQRTNFRAAMAFTLSYTKLRGLCRHYLELAAPTPTPSTQADIDALRLQAAIHNNWGNWAQAMESATQAVKSARASGDDVSLLHCLIQLELAKAALDEYADVLAMCREMERLAARTQNSRYAALAVLGQGAALLLRGDLAEAEAMFDRVRHDLPPEVGPVPEALALALSALCALRQGRDDRAEALADLATDRLERVRWDMQELRLPLKVVLEAYLVEGRYQRREARIRWTLRRLHRIARAFPCAEPSAWVAQGRYEHLSGRADRAAECIERGLRHAERLGARYDQAQAHYWLGHVSRGMDGRRVSEKARAHLRAAIDLFDHLGNPWEAARARATLESGAHCPASS